MISSSSSDTQRTNGSTLSHKHTSTQKAKSYSRLTLLSFCDLRSRFVPSFLPEVPGVAVEKLGAKVCLVPVRGRLEGPVLVRSLM